MTKALFKKKMREIRTMVGRISLDVPTSSRMLNILAGIEAQDTETILRTLYTAKVELFNRENRFAETEWEKLEKKLARTIKKIENEGIL